MKLKESLLGKRIGVFGKGGSGKSTVVVLLARALRKAAYEVCVLDADSTNVGLHRALGISQAPAPLLNYFGGCVFAGGPVTCPVDDPRPLPDAQVSLSELPEEYVGENRNGLHLLTAGKIAGQGPGAGCDGPIAKIARDIRVSGDGTTPVTLVDFKAGLEDSARGVLTSLDWALVVVEPNLAALQVATDVKETIEQIQSGSLPATEHLKESSLIESALKIYRNALIQDVFVVLNKIRDSQQKEFLENELEPVGLTVAGAIPENSEIFRAWFSGTSIEGPIGNLSETVSILEEAEARRNHPISMAP
jgi:CO dehydrogenase maturation factor